MYARHCLKLVTGRACYRRPTTAMATLSRRFASELPGQHRSSGINIEAREAMAQGTRDLLAGSTASALKNFERALSLGEATADTYYNKGVCEYSLGQTDAAISSWEQSLALDGSRADVHANIGNAYFLNKRDSKSALSHMKQAAKLAPEDAEIQFNLGCLYEASVSDKDSDLKEAIAAYDRAVQLGLEKAKTHLRNAMAKQMKRQL
ncbi:hypothetical protein GGI03_004759 [Coemansia sp. RSA 2337]|nr:hypothetical protein H4S04_003800 [Coemansia sp. S16]KAJ2069079.1 hypothetical protein GGI08_000546 [Coemansia sp. S2]KAJ2337745.1 hypothetical protein GGH92_007475 [Coemansia sp. RSA 2673]KAJ2462005.1 hypothetical protein GGI03_004759 [Coemansia sp. RSA 2337]